MELIDSILDLMAHVVGTLGFAIACAAAALANEDHCKLDELREQVDCLSGQLRKLDGVGDVAAKRKERH